MAEALSMEVDSEYMIIQLAKIANIELSCFAPV